MIAPSHGPGALYVLRTRHSVAPAFVATYRRLGLYVLGDPVAEAYAEGDVLTQDFEHLRLQVRQGHVVAWLQDWPCMQFCQHATTGKVRAVPASQRLSRAAIVGPHCALHAARVPSWRPESQLTSSTRSAGKDDVS